MKKIVVEKYVKLRKRDEKFNEKAAEKIGVKKTSVKKYVKKRKKEKKKAYDVFKKESYFIATF